MRKEYMGEMTVPFLEWFEGGDIKLWSDNLPVSAFWNPSTCLTDTLSAPESTSPID
jgi:hypothetical protein